MPASTQLDGFDISADQFPDKGWLPKNVTLNTLDSLSPLPDHLIGIYDVVHVGLVVTIIKNENPVPLLKNVLAMLSTLFACFIIAPDSFANACEIEPGGYIQWDEVDLGSLHGCFPDKSRPCPHFDAIFTQSRAFFATRHLTYR